MLKICRRVPSWAVGLTGAFVVLAHVALGPLSLQRLEEEIRSTHREIARLSQRREVLWTNHARADQHEATAEIIVSLTPQSSRATSYLANAIHAMWGGTGPDITSPTPSIADICDGFMGPEQANLEGYSWGVYCLRRLRQESGIVMSALLDDRSKSEEHLRELQLRHDQTRRWQASLNFLGLVLTVLLKDLPIWRREHTT